jgi:hypothetical protein
MSNQSVSCEGDLAPGSRIIQRCISFYHPKSKEISKTELTCQDSGEWDGPPLTCVVGEVKKLIFEYTRRTTYAEII